MKNRKMQKKILCDIIELEGSSIEKFFVREIEKRDETLLYEMVNDDSEKFIRTEKDKVE